LRHRHLGDVARLLHVVQQVDGGAVGHTQRAGQGAQPQVAVQRDRIGVHRQRHVLADREQFLQHLLARGVRGVDVEDEVATGLRHLVVELQRQAQPDHGRPIERVSACIRVFMGPPVRFDTNTGPHRHGMHHD